MTTAAGRTVPRAPIEQPLTVILGAGHSREWLVAVVFRMEPLMDGGTAG